jgi:NAD(P)-dependent dehydrogenase (short-subunit alcohol dehydrogenase family)
MNRFSVEGKVVVITGAAQGMGAAYVKAFKEEGAIVYGMDVKPAKTLLPCDVSNFNEVRLILEGIFHQDGRIDCLINNAGITRPFKDKDDWEAVIGVNLTGTRNCCKVVAEMMIGSGGGSIINIGSINSIRGFPNNDSYQASKAGVLGLTYSYAYSYAKYGVRVNAIQPAYVETPMTEYGRSNPVLKENRTRMMLLGRWGVPEDMVGLAIFLASDASSYITGAVIPVDGGWSINGLPGEQ